MCWFCTLIKLLQIWDIFWLHLSFHWKQRIPFPPHPLRPTRILQLQQGEQPTPFLSISCLRLHPDALGKRPDQSRQCCNWACLQGAVKWSCTPRKTLQLSVRLLWWGQAELPGQHQRQRGRSPHPRLHKGRKEINTNSWLAVWVVERISLIFESFLWYYLPFPLFFFLKYSKLTILLSISLAERYI